MNWFEMIWQWFVENKDTIIGWLTSANVTGLIAAIIMFVRQRKIINANTTSTKDLQDTMAQYNTFKQEVTNVVNNIVAITERVNEFQKVLDENLDVQDKITSKLDAVLNIQQVAYAKLKDDDARNAIENIVINAKYTNEGTRAELINEIETLKANAAKISEQYNKLVEDTTAKLKEVAKPVKEPEKKASVARY